MIFLADIYDPSDGVGDPASAWLPDWPDCMAIHRAYNEAIRRCAGKHKSVHVVPMHAEFLGHGIHCTQPWRAHYRSDDPHYWYAGNLEDPEPPRLRRHPPAVLDRNRQAGRKNQSVIIGL